MKTVLCYGDSLTWGHNPETLERHAYADRWPSTLQTGLGTSALVTAEGLNGRTTAFDDPTCDADRNGARILPTILASHEPLDLVVFMLGTNDLKPAIHGKALTASFGARRIVEVIRGHFVRIGDVMPKILMVAPPPMVACDNPEYTENFGDGVGESWRLAGFYKLRATELGVDYFDAAQAADTSPIDGIHLDAANTRAIGEALVPVVSKLLET